VRNPFRRPRPAPVEKSAEVRRYEACFHDAARILRRALVEQSMLEPGDRDVQLYDLCLDLQSALGVATPALPRRVPVNRGPS
jgi:hypothetical protein